VSYAAATRELVARDPALAAVIERAGPIRMRGRNPDGPFGALVRAIVFQQLAGPAAAAIHGRVRALVEGPLSPETLLAVPDTDLRGAGLSANKLAAIRDLCLKVADGTVVLEHVGRLRDEEIIERLVTVRGIGRWTAEMLLIFELRRLDVWPVDDLGVRNGYALAYGLPVAPPPRELAALGDAFRPYRSVAALYCWQAVHLARGDAA
jgi:DNA-3-methyladenine glycosylase II